MKRRFTIKLGIILTVLLSTANSFTQVNPDEVKYWVGSGSDTTYLAINFFDTWNMNTHIWGYLYDGTKTVDDLVAEVSSADANITLIKTTEIDTITLNVWTSKINSDTSSWYIFTSDLDISTWTDGILLTDDLVNGKVYGVAFNADEILVTTNPAPTNDLVYMESPTYHDASIEKVKYFVGEGDRTTVVLVDFKNPNYKNSVAFGVNYATGETLKDALDKIQLAYNGFSYDAGQFLNSISFDTLNDQHSFGYWSYKSNNLLDELGSSSTMAIGDELLVDDTYYSFVFSSGTPNNIRPVFAPAPGEGESNAISKDSSAIVSWATAAAITRGYIQLSNPMLEYQGSNKATNGELSDAVGVAEGTINDVISLGDAGEVLLTFDTPIQNEEGYDFAVFENGFENGAIELAFVEVSSDGLNFVRFPSVSVTDNTIQLANSGKQDVKNLHNLAGNFEKGFGTPFDLEELVNEDILDINNITHIKIIDAIGSINALYGSTDSYGNIINDPYPTAFGTGGFDLDGVAVLNENTVSALNTISNSKISVYPNPVISKLTVALEDDALVSITNINGNIIYSVYLNKGVNELNTKNIGLTSGMYFIQTENSSVSKLIVK